MNCHLIGPVYIRAISMTCLEVAEPFCSLKSERLTKCVDCTGDASLRGTRWVSELNLQ